MKQEMENSKNWIAPGLKPPEKLNKLCSHRVEDTIRNVNKCFFVFDELNWITEKSWLGRTPDIWTAMQTVFGGTEPKIAI